MFLRASVLACPEPAHGYLIRKQLNVVYLELLLIFLFTIVCISVSPHKSVLIFSYPGVRLLSPST